jgi:hypothetical protein
MATLKQRLCREYNWLLARVGGAKINFYRPMPTAVQAQADKVNAELAKLDSMLRHRMTRKFYYVKNGVPEKW